MLTHVRQEVLNVLLAQLLQQRGLVSAPEKILKATSADGRRHMPDVLVLYRGLRLAIEGEIGRGPEAFDKSRASALNRVVQGIAHIGVAVVYPLDSINDEFDTMRSRLSKCELHTAIVTESSDTGFTTCNVDGLVEILSRVFDELVQENAVTRAVAALDAGIDRFEVAIQSSDGIAIRLAEALGIRELGAVDKPEED
jgi:hypothetical protein